VGVVLVFRDQTEQRRLEEEAQKVQRLESLGILAGGIAHDFNNLLTGISGNVSLARVTLPPSEPAVARLVEAEKAVVRARDLTQQLLTFSKGGAPVRKTASIGEVILDSVGFALTGSAARCEVSVPDDLWAVAVDEGQINQVLHNLILNADQAMPMGGVIRVKAENVDVGERHPYPVAPGRHVRITVEDTGTGIHPEHLPRIFDPYFTTKQKGSGLGLSISYSIIRRHSGYIFVKSELGAGTTFYLYLPASRPEAPRVPKTEPAIPRGEGRVLVMDDEDIVASVAKAMLEHLGYQVEVTRDGAEAIEAWRRAHHGGKPFDALLMDLTVAGGMGGLEAVRRIRDEDPGVRAIVSSGYSSDPVMSQHERYGFCGVATKPYRIDELALVVSAACRPASDATPDSDP
jgi:nitrogen-specific signal transduction histidine kinase/CheY-like chemotaxis protein